MWEKIKRFPRYLRNVLIEDSIPVWLSLVLMAAGAISAYYIAPLINAKFEIQSARREFLVKNLEQFSVDTKGLIDVVYKGINETDQNKYNTLISDISPTISKLQFSATQLLYVVPEDHKEIVRFQKTLEDMQNEMIAYKVQSDPSIVVTQSKLLMRQALDIYEILLSKAGLGNRFSTPRKE